MIDVGMLTFNFNEDLVQLTKNAMASVKESNIDKLIIIDNASPLGGGVLREQADLYLRNKTNLGYPAGVNQIMSLASTPYVAIANNDIRVSRNWVEVAEEIFQDKMVGSVHFRMIPYEQPIVPGNDVWIGGKERWCHCSFFVLRKEAFYGYDDNYGAGGYDDYAHNHLMREHGWKQAYTNKCSFQHVDSITYRTMEDQETRKTRDGRNREYYKSKFGEYPDQEFARLFPDQLQLPYLPFP